jgi:membrane associated rhomboid family serine protease
MAWILFLGVVLFFGYRVTTAEDRVRMAQRALLIAKELVRILRHRPPELDAFRDRLRARTPIPIVAPALAVLNVVMFVVERGHAADDANAALLAWGASIGPLTTNGEWWRLLTSTFLHATFAHLVINVAVIAIVGLMLERYLGWLPVLAVYLSAGVISSLMIIRAYPVVVSAGASGAVIGLYGLLLACAIWMVIRRKREADLQAHMEAALEAAAAESELDADQAAAHASEETAVDDMRVDVPLVAIKRLAPLTLLFFFYSLANDGLPMAGELVAFGIGLAAGLFLLRESSDEKPVARQVGIAAAAAFVVAIVLAVPLHGIADVKPEIDRVVALEARTASLYETEYDRFKRGRASAQSLIQTIDRTILPDLHAEDGRLKALKHVPPEHQPLVDNAVQYVQLRSESWRLRADGLRKVGTIPARNDKQTGLPAETSWRVQAETQYRKNLLTFGKAEGAERASLEALDRIRPSREPGD